MDEGDYDFLMMGFWVFKDDEEFAALEIWIWDSFFDKDL